MRGVMVKVTVQKVMKITVQKVMKVAVQKVMSCKGSHMASLAKEKKKKNPLMMSCWLCPWTACWT